MGKQARTIQYTIRGVPPAVDRALREKAARKKKSLNEVVLEELSEAAGLRRKRRIDFSDLVGIWEPHPELDRNLEAQRQIDPDMWK